MRLRINGEERDVTDGWTVADLVASLGLAGRRVAVEYNRDVLPADRWPERRLAEDDVLEIVHFVGGG
jgi:thiamine biosynthesis protein ThiS